MSAPRVAAAYGRKLAAYNVLNVCWLLATLPTVGMLRHYTNELIDRTSAAFRGSR